MLEDKFLKPLDKQELRESSEDESPVGGSKSEGLRRRTTVKSTGSRSTLADQKEMSEYMTTQMMGSAFEMKRIAQQFGTTIKTDQQTLEEIERKQDKNLQKTKKDDDKLKKLGSSVNIGF